MILGASILQLPAIEQAKEMGVQVIQYLPLSIKVYLYNHSLSLPFLKSFFVNSRFEGIYTWLVFGAPLPHLRGCPIGPLVQFVQFFRALERKER